MIAQMVGADIGGSEADDAIVQAIADVKAVALGLADAFSDLDAESLDAEAWVEALAALGLATRQLQTPGAVIGKTLGLSSAKRRMLEYLLIHQGEVVSNYALSGVAGTLEWARRVRELQLEEGWPITAGPHGGLRPGEYRMEDSGADESRAESWRLRNEVRRAEGSGASRCLEYLRRVFPAAASKEDLQYVARINEWPRRMRELEEAGWSIVSSVDDSSLPPGSYRLESPEQGPPRERHAIKQRHEILKRDDWTCQSCGASPRITAGTRLQIHHRRHVKHGGQNEDANLVTLCTECHLGVHSSELSETSDELLEPGRDPWLADPLAGISAET
jgi:hypothetical protein